MARVFRPGKAVFCITRERSFLLCQFFHGLPHGICREQERSAAAVYFHMASYITHFKILHRGSLPYPFFADFWNLFGSMAVLSHSSGPINRISNPFQNKDRPVPSAEQGGLLHIIIWRDAAFLSQWTAAYSRMCFSSCCSARVLS